MHFLKQNKITEKGTFDLPALHISLVPVIFVVL